MQNLNQLESLVRVAEYVVSFDSGEHDNYITWCEELEIDPSNITGQVQSTHVYSLALIGLGLEFSLE